MIIKADKQFNMFPSDSELRKYILYYNIVFPYDDMFTAQYTLMPDACGTLSLAFDGKTVIAELWGASLAPVLLGAEPNNYLVLLLIQLSPIGLYRITGQNQAEFAGKRLSLFDVDNELYRSLLEAVLRSETADGLAKACEMVLYKRMNKHSVSDAVVLATSQISDTHGQLQVSEIAQNVCYSERQLNRLFLTQVGMNIKNYARITRFNYVLKNIKNSSSFLTTLSQQAGYFDQAHFDKDFKLICGVSPQNYVKTMSDFYYDGTEIYDTISSRED